MTKHVAVPAEITLEAATETEPALGCAANVTCADMPPRLING